MEQKGKLRTFEASPPVEGVPVAACGTPPPPTLPWPPAAPHQWVGLAAA